MQQSSSVSAAVVGGRRRGGAGGVLRGRQGEAEVEVEEQAQLEGIELLQMDAIDLGPGEGIESVLLQAMCLKIWIDTPAAHTGKWLGQPYLRTSLLKSLEMAQQE